MKKFALATGALAAVILMGAGCSRPVAQVQQPQKNNAVSALSEDEIFTASYTIGANSSVGIPTAKIVFPPFKSGETRLPALTGTVFVYSDGTSSTELISGKDYEYFWISKYDFNADHSAATVDITGNFAGEMNDNRTFLVSKVDGKIITKEEGKNQPAVLPSIGGQKDEHGCLIGAGYSWCATKNMCIRAWEESCAPKTSMNESEALAIAEKSCVKTGEKVVSPGSYNENSKTWWFDAKLKATPSGCNPACVVSADTKKAEINWRCTGTIMPSNANVNTK